MSEYIVWFMCEGNEEYVIITASSRDQALERFALDYGYTVLDCHKITNKKEW